MDFTLLGEPLSTQSLYGLTCRGKFPTRYMTARGKKPIKGAVGMEVKLYFGTKRKQDIDNFNKILYDAFTGIVWEDDCQIESVLTEKKYDKKNPRVELEVYEILK